MTTNSSHTKKIFVPDSSEEVLLGWLIHSHKGRQRHDRAARRLERQRLWIGAIAATFAAIVGAAVFNALQKESSNTLKITLAMTSMLAAVLASLSTFLNLAERAERHRAAGVQYKAMIRELERRFGETARLTSPPYIIDLEKRLNELEESAPIVPQTVFLQVDKEWETNGVEKIKSALEFYRVGPKKSGLIEA